MDRPKNPDSSDRKRNHENVAQFISIDSIPSGQKMGGSHFWSIPTRSQRAELCVSQPSFPISTPLRPTYGRKPTH
jgi:hypothetical protein